MSSESIERLRFLDEINVSRIRAWSIELSVVYYDRAQYMHKKHVVVGCIEQKSNDNDDNVYLCSSVDKS
jgi:hypothetical protein